MKAPVLQTDRLIIKALRKQDAKTMFCYRSDPRVTQFQTWHPASEVEVSRFIEKYSGREFIRHNSWYQMGVYFQQSGELVGDIGIHDLHKGHQYIEIGYTISPLHQRKGHAFEALNAVLVFLFRSLQAACVIADIDPGNAASIALVSKLGFKNNAPDNIGWLTSERVVENVYFLEKTDREVANGFS